jgi:hypothetical protein
VVEGTGLENRHTGEPGIESSNLSLSAPVSREASVAAFRFGANQKDVGTGGRVV